MNDTPKKRRRWAWPVLLLLVVGSCSSLAALSIDDDPPDDAELLALPPLVGNAYEELCDLHEQAFAQPSPEVVAAEEALVSGEASPRAILAEYLTDNAAVLDRVRELAVERPLRASAADPVSDLFEVEALAHWLAVRARVRAREGRSAEAFEDAIAVLSLGMRAQADAGSLMDWLIGLGIRGSAVGAFEDVLSRVALDDGQLAELARRLAASPEPRGLAGALRGEYREALFTLVPLRGENLPRSYHWEGVEDALPSLASGLLGTPLEGLVFKPNRTRAFLARHILGQVADLESGQPPRAAERFGAFEELASTNCVGRALVRGNYVLEESQLIKVQAKLRLARLDVCSLQTLIALRRFQAAEGRWPGALEELCPRYLKSIPEDLDGRPLRYSAADQVLYSIGEDGRDDFAASRDPKEENDRLWSLRRARRP